MIKLKQLGILIISWLTISVLISLYDYFLLNSRASLGANEWYSFHSGLIFNSVAAFIGSLFGGIFLIFYVNDKWRDQSYGRNIMAVLISFFVIFSFVTLLSAIAVPLFLLQASWGSETFWKAFNLHISDPLHLKNLIVWLGVVAITQFAIMLNDKFGQGVLMQFITGRYHHPRTEERIFMFADINSSTTIAEQLGNEKYHLLLKDFFADITNAIVENKGQIYQYVGDEVVISWQSDQGLNGNCIRCYLDMRASILSKKDKYLEKYGVIPEFKAGLHYGEVIAGEIGVIKRDLTFSGDVLNTTSRIQEECKKHNVDLLASDQLLAMMKSNFTFKHIGEINLRGKRELVGLSTFIA